MSTKKVNLLQLSTWLTQATGHNKNFLLKPKDLHVIYLIFLWEYLSKYHTAKKVTEKVPVIKNDEQISIPETDLINIIQTFYQESYYPYFNNLNNI